MVGSALYDHAERVWRAMYAEAIRWPSFTGRDAYLGGMVPVGILGRVSWIGSLS